MNEPVVYLEQPRPRDEVLRIGASEYKGQQYVDIRIWFTDKNGEKRPGKAGVSLRMEAIPDVIRALQEAEKALQGAPS